MGSGIGGGNWNIIGPHHHIRGGTNSRYGFVGVGVALLEEVCHCEGGL